MDRFKLHPGDIASYPIDSDTYSEVTQDGEPWVLKKNGKTSLRAVCPWCDGPIIIVGLHRREGDSEAGKGYGRHHRGSIEMLAEYDQKAFDNCPVADPGRIAPGLATRRPDDPAGIRLYELMRDHFDKVVYAWNKTMPVWMSIALAEAWIKEWRADEGWRDYGLRVQNLPYMLARTRAAKGLVGRKVRNGSEFAAQLARVGAVSLEDCGNGYSKVTALEGFVNLTFSVVSHKTRMDDESLRETFKVSAAIDAKPVASETVTVDQTLMENLIGMGDRWRPVGVLREIACNALTG